MVETTMFFTSADSPWCTLFKTVVIFVVSIMDQKLGVPQNGTLKISKYWGVYNIMGRLNDTMRLKGKMRHNPTYPSN
jgi:hypothetical protein